MPFQPSYHVPKNRRAYTVEAGPVGCLMLHGFLGSPTSSRPLAGYLAEHGITVHCPLLPGHGELPNKLYMIRHQTWIAEAEEALVSLRRRCNEIFLMGHSMGTVLCAYLAHKNHDLCGLIMLAPAYDVPDRRIRLLKILRFVMPWFHPLRHKKFTSLVRERLLDFDPNLDFDDPEIQARLPEMTRVPTSGMDEMRKVLDMGKALWPQLHIPVVIFQGERDIAVSTKNTQKLYDILPVSDKRLHLFRQAGHELMRPFEPVHAEVWPRVLEFIRARSSHLKALSTVDNNEGRYEAPLAR